MIINKIHKIKNNVFFNHIIRVEFEWFLWLFFAALYNTYSMTFDNATDYYANIVGFIWLILLSFLLVLVIVIMLNHNPNISIIKRFSILFKDFKEEKKIWYLVHVMFMLRRMFLSFLIVFGYQHGLIQWVIFLIIWILVVVLKTIIRPYKDILSNIHDLIMEIVLLCLVIIFTTFYDKATEFADHGWAQVIGWIWFSMIVFLVMINYANLFYVIIKRCVERKQKKRKETYITHPKETSLEISKPVKTFEYSDQKSVSDLQKV